MLTARRETILKAIIGEYVTSAVPVPSDDLVHKYPLKVSPATIRNEMAALEKGGYITRPHTSAGGVPTSKGYRYYVETLEGGGELPEGEQRLISDLFHQVEGELEEWSRLAAALLSRLTRNAALVSLPRSTQCSLRHLELIALHQFLALLVVVLREARLRERLLSLGEGLSQEELNAISLRLNPLFVGLTSSQIAERSQGLSPAEQQVAGALQHIMQEEDQGGYPALHLQGVKELLAQPEFTRSDKMLRLLEMLEAREVARAILPQLPQWEGVQVIIGEENREEALQELSVVVARYGVPGEASGAIAVVGPTRMPYGHVISSVRHLAGVLNTLMAELYGFRSPSN